METKNNKNQNIVTITLNKALLIVATAVLTSLGAGIWTAFNFVNSAPFRISAMEDKIEEIKIVVDDNNQKFMPLDLSTEKWKNNDKEHADMIKKLDAIDSKLDRLLN